MKVQVKSIKLTWQLFLSAAGVNCLVVASTASQGFPFGACVHLETVKILVTVVHSAGSVSYTWSCVLSSPCFPYHERFLPHGL